MILYPCSNLVVIVIRHRLGRRSTGCRIIWKIEHRKDTDVLEIKFQALTPYECAYVTNAIAQEFKILNSETSQGEVTDLRDFLESQVAKKEEELRSAEDKLRGYQERKKVANLDDETSQLVSRMAQAESMLEQSKIELNSAREKNKSLNSQLEERKASLAKIWGEPPRLTFFPCSSN